MIRLCDEGHLFKWVKSFVLARAIRTPLREYALYVMTYQSSRRVLVGIPRRTPRKLRMDPPAQEPETAAGPRFEAESITAAGQADNRSSGTKMGSKEHDVFAVMFHDCHIVHGLHPEGDLAFGENRIVRVPPDYFRLHVTFFSSIARMVVYTLSYCCTILSTEKHCVTRCLHALRSI